MEGMQAVLAKLDDERSSETTFTLCERWKARLESHRNRQELAETREREREARRRAKADREAAEALCNLEPEIFDERLEMVMRRASELEPVVLEPEAAAALRQAAGHAGDAIMELTRRRVRAESEASSVEAAIVLRTTPPGASVEARQEVFRLALAGVLDSLDDSRIHVSGMGPAGSIAPSDPSKVGSPPPATPGFLRLSFRILEPFGRDVDDGAPSSEAVLHRLDEVSIEGGGLEDTMEAVGGLVRYEPDKQAAARAQSREVKALAALGVTEDSAAKVAADAKAEEEKRAGCEPIPLPFRRVTYAVVSPPASDLAEGEAPSGVVPVFDHSAVWLWYYIEGSDDWPEKDREGMRRVVFKYRRLRFGGGHEGIDDEPEVEPEPEPEPGKAPLSEADAAAAKERSREKRKQRKAALSDPVKAAFEQYDVDGSGSLDLEEVTALLHDRGFRMSSAELAGVFEAIDDDENGVLDLGEVRKMWTFLGMHMTARGTTREVSHASEEEMEEEETAVVLPEVATGVPAADTTGWCALSGPASKAEDGWWRSCSWPVSPGFEHSVWVDGKMAGTYHDPSYVVTAAPNEVDVEEEEDEPVVMVTKIGTRTVTTVMAASRKDGSKKKKKRPDGPRQLGFAPVLLHREAAWQRPSAPISEAVAAGGAGLHSGLSTGHLFVTVERCVGLKRRKEDRADGVFCVVAAGTSGLARRSGTVYDSGKTLSWKGHHGTTVFSRLDAAPQLLHVFVLRRSPAASVVNAATRPQSPPRMSARAVRNALVDKQMHMHR